MAVGQSLRGQAEQREGEGEIEKREGVMRKKNKIKKEPLRMNRRVERAIRQYQSVRKDALD